MITRTELDRLKELEKNATEGPWEFERVCHDGGEFSYERNDKNAFMVLYESDYKNKMKAKFDSSLISESRNLLPKLIEGFEVMRDACLRIAKIEAYDGDNFDGVHEDVIIRVEMTAGDIQACRDALSKAIGVK